MGIYYKHDDEYILRGKAMIIGPEGTPYENGMYFFSFKFPEDYPTSPPKVKMYTEWFNPISSKFVSQRQSMSQYFEYLARRWMDILSRHRVLFCSHLKVL